MKVIYIHQYFSLPSLAGGTRSYDLATKFKDAGHNIVLVTSSAYLKGFNFDKKWTVIDYEGLELHVLLLNYDSKLKNLARIKVFLKFIYHSTIRLLKLKGDVVLTSSTPITVAIPAIVKKLLHNTPFVFEVRDVWPEVPIAMGVIRNGMAIRLLNMFEKYIYNQASHIIPLSSDMSKSISTRTEVKNNKITVIPNISEIKRFSLFDSRRSMLTDLLGFKPEKVVLYAGSLGMVNGLKYMIDLAKHSSKIDPSIKYIILGDGKEKMELIKYSESEGILNQNLYFLDPIPKALLPQVYEECTVATSFVIPIEELWANSANKFFDCLAAGRPIVINHRGWQADLIEEKSIGFVFSENVSLLPEETIRFCNYINNYPLIEQQGCNARKLAEERYTLEIAADKYIKVLQNAAIS